MFPWRPSHLPSTICFVCYHLRVFSLASKVKLFSVPNFWSRNMFIFNCMLIISGLCELIFAELKLCSEPQDKKSKKEAFICLTNETGYSAPFPINSTQELYFKNIIKIDEDLNSISIQAQLWTYWSDPGLTLKNDQE